MQVQEPDGQWLNNPMTYTVYRYINNTMVDVGYSSEIAMVDAMLGEPREAHAKHDRGVHLKNYQGSSLTPFATAKTTTRSIQVFVPSTKTRLVCPPKACVVCTQKRAWFVPENVRGFCYRKTCVQFLRG